MDTQSKRRNFLLMAALASIVGAKAQSEKADSWATDSLLAAYEDDQRLGEAVVRVRRPAYVRHIDKKVFNASSDVMNASLSASELMQNL